jgi:hypothetical protein
MQSYNRTLFNSSSRAVAHNSSSRGLAVPAPIKLKSIPSQTGTGVVQACWATTGKAKIPVYTSAKSPLALVQLDAGIEVKRLNKSMHFGRYNIQVLTGKYKDQVGYVKHDQIAKMPEPIGQDEKNIGRGKEEEELREEEPVKIKAKGKGKAEAEAPAPAPALPSAYAKLLGGEETKKRKRGEANAWSARVPAVVKDPRKMPHDFQDQFGGAADIYTQKGVSGFNTPPGSPNIHENELRREATPEEIDNGIIFNFGQQAGDVAKYGGDYSNYTLFGGKGGSFGVEKDDRHDVRLSSLLFNQAAAQAPSGTLRAKPLTAKEEVDKERYQKRARKELDLEGKGGTIMHEPDQQFLPEEDPARARGGSLMGTHHGTKTANALTGQVLHHLHPQYRKAVGGVGSMLVKEIDGNIYYYGPHAQEEEEQQPQ